MVFKSGCIRGITMDVRHLPFIFACNCIHLQGLPTWVFEMILI